MTCLSVAAAIDPTAEVMVHRTEASETPLYAVPVQVHVHFGGVDLFGPPAVVLAALERAYLAVAPHVEVDPGEETPRLVGLLGDH